MKNILIFNLLAFVLLATSCGKEDPAPAPVKVEWTEAPGFTSAQKRALNTAIWDDQLFILTDRSVAETEPDGNAFHRFHSGANSDFKMPFSEDYFITLDQGRLGFYASKNPTTSGNSFGLGFQQIGGDIVATHPWLSASALAINSRGQMLVPFVRSNGAGVLALLNVQMKDNGLYWEVDNVTPQLINLFDFSWIGAINAIGENFFVSFSSTSQNISGTARISPEGNVILILNQDDHLQRIMPINGQWYAFSKDGLLFRSDNNGLDWTSLGEPVAVGLKDFSNFTQGYTFIDGQTVFYNDDAIFLIANNPAGGFIQKTVTMEGLAGNSITAVTAWQDNVFVTTLTGVFLMSKANFLESAM